MGASEFLLNVNVKRIVLLLLIATSVIPFLIQSDSVNVAVPWALYVLCGALSLWYLVNGIRSGEEIDPGVMTGILLMYVVFRGEFLIVPIVAAAILILDFIEDDVKSSLIVLIVAGISLAVSMLFPGSLPSDPAWVAIVLCGAPIIWDAVTGLILRHDIKADVLVAIAIVAALYLGEWFAAGEVALIMEIGGFLEDFSAARANKGIEALQNMSPKTGRIVRGNEVEDVPVEAIEVGQTLRVLPGEAVPVDGRIVSGESSIDQSVITGESMPVDKVPGDAVFSGTINQMGAFDMVVEKSSGESSFQRMVGMVSSVDAEKTRMVRTADRWATWLVATVMILALLTYLLTNDIYRAVTVCIVFCPCAFILATPTAVVAAIGNLARRGVLVRDGDSLERMSQIDTVAFDKTGTITEGRPRIAEVFSVGDREKLISLIASAESNSTHPLAKAYMEYAQEHGIQYVRPESFRMTVGRGIEAVAEGKCILVGNSKMMEEAGIILTDDVIEGSLVHYNEGRTVVFVSVDRVFVGYVVFSDTIRQNAKDTVDGLRSQGIGCILLTGDNERAAAHMSADAGIEMYVSECTPEVKVSAIEERQSAGGKVCMVGDGVNDAPALKKAWVGIAMGATGTDIAADASDMVLVKDGLESLPHLIGITRKMIGKIRFNIAFSMCWNFLAVGLSMLAILGPVTGALVHNVGSVLVVVNSALLLLYGRKK